MKRYVLFIVLIFAVSTMVKGGDDGGIKFKGLVQTWLSSAQQESDDDTGYGFTLRRVRLKPYGSFSKTVKWSIQLAWDKQNTALLDAFLDFIFSPQFKLRVGQFTAPGSVSGALTSSGKLDLVERAAISQRWGGFSALTGYRGIGVQAYGDLMEGKLYYAVMVANPKTSALFTPSIKSTDYEHDHNGITLWGRLEARPTKGLRIGAFYGGGKEEDTDIVRSSYGAHLFYVKGGINIKFEYIAGEHGLDGAETKYSGYYAVLGYKKDKWEPVVRYDVYSPNDGDPDGAGVESYNNITVGVNYFMSKKVKLQANYVIRNETMAAGIARIKNNLFYICWQYSL